MQLKNVAVDALKLAEKTRVGKITTTDQMSNAKKRDRCRINNAKNLLGSNAQSSSERRGFSPFTHCSAILSTPKKRGKNRTKKANAEITVEGKNAISLNREKSIFTSIFSTDVAKKIDDTEPINCTNEKTQKSDEKTVNILKKLRLNTAKASFKTEKGDNIKKTPTHFFDIIPFECRKNQNG